MTTIAIIGAGSALDAAVARRFGAEGFSIALVCRAPWRMTTLVGQLTASGVRAAGFDADARDPGALAAALKLAVADLGPIEVLQYGAVRAREQVRPMLQTMAGDLRSSVNFSVHGAHAAVQEVLGGMEMLGRGTVLFVDGGGAVQPNPSAVGASVAFVSLSDCAQMLHTALAGQNIHVAQLIVPRDIQVGHPTHDPDVLAQRLWQLHTDPLIFQDFADTRARPRPGH